MSSAILVLSIIALLVILLNFSLLILWQFIKRKNHQNKLNELPKVSILIAARNEAHNIGNCLRSLLALDYPNHKVEILVGDDASSDDTFKIANQITSKYDHIQVKKVINNLGLAKGKANVLAHLAQIAKGEYFLITDADVKVPSTWVKGMLKGLKSGVGIVNGFTQVEGNVWQNIDWIFALGMVKVITDYSRPVTAMGNNMLISKEAYDSVGGYESLPFSVTEDFELFKHVSAKGYGVIQLANPEIKAITYPQKGFGALLNQRKRWMIGAVQLPWQVVILLLLQAIYYPAIIILLLIQPLIGCVFFFVKLLVQMFFIQNVARTLNIKLNYIKMLLYEGYSMVVSLGTGLFYLLPISINWKGRKY